jgi:hypothetical protein
MTSIPAAHGDASPVRLIPVATSLGILIYLPEPVCRALAPAGGKVPLGDVLLPPTCDPPAVGEGGRYSRPRTLGEWAQAFRVHEKTLSRWFRTGQVDARRQGKFWCVSERDVPRSDSR